MTVQDPAIDHFGDLMVPEAQAHSHPAAAREQEAAHRQTRPLALIGSPLLLLLAAQTLGWTVDLLFYGKPLGISVPIFVSLVVGALFALAGRERVRPAARNMWLLAPIFFFACMTFIRANATLTFLNVAATLVLLALFAYFFTGGAAHRLGVLGTIVAPLDVFVNSLVQPPSTISAASRGMTNVRERSHGWVMPLLRGFLVAIPVLLVFIWLLSAADMVFARLVSDVLQLKIFNNVNEWAGRITLILVSAWLLMGGMTYALSRGRLGQGDPYEMRQGGRTSARLLGMVEATTVLVLVNILFAVFAWIQFTYVFFGPLKSLYYEDYRVYVRQGFGELLFAAVLTMVLIVGLRRLARVDTPAQARLYNTLSTLMVALTGVMILSAYRRMLVWEEVQFYISTPVRIYVRAFIGWLSLTFGWLLFALWVRLDRFAIGLLLAAVGFLATINLTDPDASVAAYNLRRTDELATRFLYVLSEDAVPTLVAGFDRATDPVIKENLRGYLLWRLEYFDRDRSMGYWQSYHVSRARAYSLLDGIRDRLEPPQSRVITLPGMPK